MFRRMLLLLRIRNAIASKEWITACSNMELTTIGHWTADWSSCIREIQAEISELMEEL
jgi:hypothetical protein